MIIIITILLTGKTLCVQTLDSVIFATANIALFFQLDAICSAIFK